MTISAAPDQPIEQEFDTLERTPPSPWQRPELLGQYLEMDHKQVVELLMTTEGRDALYNQLLEKQDLLEEQFPDLDVAKIRSDLDSLGRELELQMEILREKERFLKDVSAPEKQGIFRRSWESVKSFTKKHPIVVALLGLAAVTGGVAATAYFAGGVEALLAKVGLSHLYGAAGAAEATEALGNIIEGGKDLFPDVYNAPTGGDML